MKTISHLSFQLNNGKTAQLVQVTEFAECANPDFNKTTVRVVADHRSFTQNFDTPEEGLAFAKPWMKQFASEMASAYL